MNVVWQSCLLRVTGYWRRGGRGGGEGGEGKKDIHSKRLERHWVLLQKQSSIMHM